jgi:hypothetical protein
MSIDNGDRVKDIITDFEGIVTARCEYINGCVQYEITGEGLTEDGLPLKEYWVDAQRLVLIRDNAFEEDIQDFKLDHEEKADSTITYSGGGPANHPPKKHPNSLAGFDN